jgi:hypothetical protein
LQTSDPEIKDLVDKMILRIRALYQKQIEVISKK